MEPLWAPEEEEDLLPEATLADVARWMKPGRRTAQLIQAAIRSSCLCCAVIAAAFLADRQLLPATAGLGAIMVPVKSTSPKD